LTANSTFCPSRRTPKTTKSEMFVALRSSRTRTTVPSRIKRTMGVSKTWGGLLAFGGLIGVADA